MAELTHFSPAGWQQMAGTRARRKALRRVDAWHSRQVHELRRLNAPPAALADLADLAAKLRELAPD